MPCAPVLAKTEPEGDAVVADAEVHGDFTMGKGEKEAVLLRGKEGRGQE